jgi:hypothetical protein
MLTILVDTEILHCQTRVELTALGERLKQDIERYSEWDAESVAHVRATYGRRLKELQ